MKLITHWHHQLVSPAPQRDKSRLYPGPTWWGGGRRVLGQGQEDRNGGSQHPAQATRRLLQAFSPLCTFTRAMPATQAAIQLKPLALRVTNQNKRLSRPRN